MPGVSAPIVSPEDLGIYLGDTTINVPRAELFIDLAQTLCESEVSPLPVGAEVVVIRMAATAYATVTSARQVQAAAAGMPFGALPSGGGAVRLTPTDIADLRRLAGGGGAFTIDMLPAGYVLPFAPWDSYFNGFDTIP